MKLSDWVGKLYGFDRMKEYESKYGSIPSGPSHKPHEHKETFKTWCDFKGYGHTYKPTTPTETIRIGGEEITLHSNSILVVPEGQLCYVPEKFQDITIELPNSYGYAVIR